MANKVYKDAKSALEGLLRDDLMLMCGGFGLVGIPDKLIHAPWKAGPLELAAAGVSLVDAGEAIGPASYPRPIVDHAAARDRTLARYSVVKGAVA